MFGYSYILPQKTVINITLSRYLSNLLAFSSPLLKKKERRRKRVKEIGPLN